jgi:monofunctional glycosyltransferase
VPRRAGWARAALRVTGRAALAAACLPVFAMVILRWVDPPVTGVQVQRRIETLFHSAPYRKHYTPVRLNRIAVDLQHAAIAAEDGRFYDHHGIDFQELKKVVREDLEEGSIGRGGSTITQQVVKNIFLTTHRSFIRKGLEFVLAPPAELILPKQRILELYLNISEWGPGVYGAEAAARYHYKVSASALSREQSARLAAILPSPVRRKPARMNDYSADILTRMRQMGW